MRAFLRQFLAALTHSGPGYLPAQIPARGDAAEAWLKAQRDAHSDRYGVTPAWFILDDLLDLYRLHADTRTPLGEHICEGRAAGDCQCLEVEA